MHKSHASKTRDVTKLEFERFDQIRNSTNVLSALLCQMHRQPESTDNPFFSEIQPIRQTTVTYE